MKTTLHPALAELEAKLKPANITQIHDPVLAQYDIELWIKREDLLHPIISGNKWRKLKYILDHALKQGSTRIITMGGAYSNHLHALAFVGQALDLKTTGIVRGERPVKLNPTLKDIIDWGMDLHFVSRSAFTDLRKHKHWNSSPTQQFQGYWIPEGGCNRKALAGIGEMVQEVRLPFDYITVPCGTGTTLAGIARALPPDRTALGFAVLKRAGFLNQEVQDLMQTDDPTHEFKQPPPEILLDYHFGGFAKSTPELLDFMCGFTSRTGIALDPIYTGKMMYGLYDLIRTQKFVKGSRIVAVHTGGLQGARSGS